MKDLAEEWRTGGSCCCDFYGVALTLMLIGCSKMKAWADNALLQGRGGRSSS